MSLATEIQIDWDDLDAFGHVNNLSILRYVQTSRIRVCEEAGLMKGSTRPECGPILAATSCRYLRPLYYPGVVRVESMVTEVKHTSFLIRHTILDDAGSIAATAEDVLEYIDYLHEEKMPVPAALRARLSA
ncbi:MAG: acyl-CoA thioesterase [Methanocorpusculum sp.]|nr:acyl-CoA thioesterase [Methanocorpusculum sp.]